jgi:hypothetical protein
MATAAGSWARLYGPERAARAELKSQSKRRQIAERQQRLQRRLRHR